LWQSQTHHYKSHSESKIITLIIILYSSDLSSLPEKCWALEKTHYAWSCVHRATKLIFWYYKKTLHICKHTLRTHVLRKERSTIVAVSEYHLWFTDTHLRPDKTCHIFNETSRVNQWHIEILDTNISVNNWNVRIFVIHNIHIVVHTILSPDKIEYSFHHQNGQLVKKKINGTLLLYRQLKKH